MGLRSQPRSDEPSDLADWFEYELLRGESWRVTEENARDNLVRASLNDSFGTAVPGAVLTMNRRAKRLANGYPLEPTAGGLRIRSDVSDCLPYMVLLAISLVDTADTDGTVVVAATAFEEFCEAVLPSVGGPGGHSVHFGWPTRSGRPEGFSDAIRWLASMMHLPPGSGYRDPRRRDGGVDIVSWRSLPDAQTFDHRLVQCTIGHDVRNKARDIDVNQWNRWIAFREPPRVGLAVPYQLAKRSLDRREVENLGHVVLDRQQLVLSARPGDPDLERLCLRMLDRLRSSAIAA